MLSSLPVGEVCGANQFWSFMVYDTQHRSMLETDQASAGLRSRYWDYPAAAGIGQTVWRAILKSMDVPPHDNKYGKYNDNNDNKDNFLALPLRDHRNCYRGLCCVLFRDN
ncbi:MAG: hypothetical protein EP297_11145 [Gammaproteobacteria bacterium]|nr:MAG: hypothetical protein EP297_11145 [Gammaproteobacteria bacterium]